MTGFAILALATWMLGRLTLDIAMWNIVVPNVLAGLALGLIFAPLTTATLGTLPTEQIGNATGLYNLMRNLGGSIGIQEQLEALRGALAAGVGPAEATERAQAILYDLLVGQATLLSYVDNFRKISLVCLACIPPVLLFRRVRPRPEAQAVH